jgi:hypothetical protein
MNSHKLLAAFGAIVLVAVGLAACDRTQFSRSITAGWAETSIDMRTGQGAAVQLKLEWVRAASTSVSLDLAAPPGVRAVPRAAPSCTTTTGNCRDNVIVDISVDVDAVPQESAIQAEAYLTDNSTPALSFLDASLTDRSAASLRIRIFAAGSPDAPADLAASGRTLAVALTWRADPLVTRYELERQLSDAPPGAWTPVAVLAAGSTGHVDSGLAPDTPYRYRLVPFNAAGRGPEALAEARTLVGSGPRTFPLQLTVDGDIAGRVTSAPAGIDCPGACRADFVEGSTVTLTAAAAANGVASWSGSSGCSGTTTSVNVLMSGNSSCRATFSATPPTVPPGWTSAGSVRTVPGLLGAPAVAFDANGEPTVAYVEQGTSTDRGALRVVRRRGGLWLLVSVDPVNASAPAATGSPGLVLLANGEPVVAWTNETGEMRVSAWNGTAWSPFGNGNLAFGGRTTPASAPQLDRLGDRLVAAWTEGTTSGARIVVARWDLAAASTQPVSTSVVPGAGSSGGLVARLALDRGGNASLLLLRTGITGAELPLRLLRESLGWQTACPDLGSGGGLANTSIGFDVQHDRLRDDSAVVLRPSADYRQVLGARCVNGSWQPLGLSANGVVAEVDNIGRTLRQVRLVAERGGRGPVALVAIDDGYRASTSYVQALLGDAGFEVAPGLERARIARGGTLGAAALGAGAIGLVQGFELGSAIEIEVWRFAP